MFYQKKVHDVVEVLELEGDVDDYDATGETLHIAGGGHAAEEIEVDEDDGESGDDMIYS
jgi:hypothetical protein